jgi:hypothetical protein
MCHFEESSHYTFLTFQGGFSLHVPHISRRVLTTRFLLFVKSSRHVHKSSRSIADTNFFTCLIWPLYIPLLSFFTPCKRPFGSGALLESQVCNSAICLHLVQAMTLASSTTNALVLLEPYLTLTQLLYTKAHDSHMFCLCLNFLKSVKRFF